MDASIRDVDIQLFLRSRYGIVVSCEEVRFTILAGLGGSGTALGDDDDVIDLMEIVAMLLIPTLLKAARMESGEGQLPKAIIKPPAGVLDYALKMILHDVTGDTSPKRLTTELVKDILTSYGEAKLATDERLVREMVEAVTQPSAEQPISGDQSFPSTSHQGDGVGFDSTNGQAHYSTNGLLDVKAFAMALTYDVGLYDINNECRESIHFDDVFPAEMQADVSFTGHDCWLQKGSDNGQDQEVPPTSGEGENGQLQGDSVDRAFTAPSIDFTAGTYRSKCLTVFLVGTSLLYYFTYIYSAYGSDGAAISFNCPPYESPASWYSNADALGCELGARIITWLYTFFQLCLFGLTVVGLGSLGNDVSNKVIWKPAVGFIVCVYGSFYPLSLPSSATQGGGYLVAACFIFGLITCAFHASHVLKLVMHRSTLASLPPIVQGFVNLSTVQAESNVKYAAARKLNFMLQNALDLSAMKDQHIALESHFGQALHAYGKSGERWVKRGGWSWCWKRIINMQAFRKDGIWLSSRLVSSNIIQYIVTLYILIFGFQLTYQAAKNFDSSDAHQVVTTAFDYVWTPALDDATVSQYSNNLTNSIAQVLASSPATYGCPNTTDAEAIFNSNCVSVSDTGIYQCNGTSEMNYLCALSSPNITSLNNTARDALLNAAGVDTASIQATTQTMLQEAVNQTVDSLYPSDMYMVVLPMIVGTLVAFSTAAYISSCYLPSVVTTVLKLRCGAIPTLRDKNFSLYRISQDQTAILMGSLFWGCVASAILVGFVVGGLAFLVVWQATEYFAQRSVALFVGIGVVFLVRFLIVFRCRFGYFDGFYRRHPAAANICMLALEWATFALSVGFVLVRMVKLVLVAACCVGRIDTPFLAPDIGSVGPIQLDNYPIVHLKEVLAQEAHRHPYIELLGVIYLMKMRFRDDFGKNAGSCWRLIFVYALFPWLHPYRVLARLELVPPTAESEMDSTLEFDRLSFVHLRPALEENRNPEKAGTAKDSGGHLQHVRNDLLRRNSISASQWALLAENIIASRRERIGMPGQQSTRTGIGHTQEYEASQFSSKILELENEVAMLRRELAAIGKAQLE